MFAPITRILVVDDLMNIRQLLKNQLRLKGYKRLLEADNGENAYKALETAMAACDPVQLILSDWNMPNGNGIEFLKKIRASAEFKELPFLLITAEGEQHQVLEAIKAGVSGYLVKPFTPASLQSKLLGVYKKHFLAAKAA